jgi:hypothetical protein
VLRMGAGGPGGNGRMSGPLEGHQRQHSEFANSGGHMFYVDRISLTSWNVICGLHSCRYSGWEHTLHSVLVPALRQHQPDGVLGFSQGAAATALLLSSLESAQSSPDGDEALKACPRPRYPALPCGSLGTRQCCSTMSLVPFLDISLT